MKEEFFSYCVCYSDSLLNLYWCDDDTLKSIFSFLTDVTALCRASVEDLGDVHQGTGLLTILHSSGIAVTKKLTAGISSTMHSLLDLSIKGFKDEATPGPQCSPHFNTSRQVD